MSLEQNKNFRHDRPDIFRPVLFISRKRRQESAAASATAYAMYERPE
jgi:hypothetical protein